jgi:hypothetical protein
VNIVEQVRDLVPTFRQRQQFRGLGGEFMKQACSLLIEKCSLAAMPFHNHSIIGKLECNCNVFGLFSHFAICIISVKVLCSLIMKLQVLGRGNEMM